jgi:tRNA(Ile)-lysidine synthase
MNHPMLDKLRAALSSGRLIPPKSRVLVALSGGADSVALLHGLLAIQAELDFRVFAAHLNHGIRGETADSDEDFCKSICASWGVSFFSKKVDCPALALERKQTLEEAARFARYAFLEETAKNIRADRIAVAHHRDDQAETVLLNLLRGTGASGLRAMRPSRNAIVRPLLFVSKGEILDYVSQHGLPFVQDETNANKEHSRNRLRALDPELRLINPAYVQNICRAASLIGEDDDALCAWAKDELEKARREEGLSCAHVNGLPRAVSGRVLRMYAAFRGLKTDLSLRHVDALRRICRIPTGASVDLPCGFAARVDYGVLTIAPAKGAGFTPDYCVPLEVEGETITPLGVLTASIIPRPKALKASPLECFADIAAMDGAIVRTRRPGDVIHPLGAPGRKKLKDFYIDRKIRREDRRLPIIAKGSKVLWAVGAGISQIAAVNGQKTVLWLKFAPYGPRSEVID